MQERSEPERRAIWPCLNVILGEGSEATEPYNKYDKIRPHSIRSVQFDQKVRPLSFRPEKFDLFTATLCKHIPVIFRRNVHFLSINATNAHSPTFTVCT